MKRILKPFKGLDDIEFGMPIKKVQEMVNIKESKVTNKYLNESKVFADKIAYVFNEDILVTIELEYQNGIYFNEVDIFNVNDPDEVLKGFKIESKKDNIHVKELGVILIDFKKKDKTKRTIWFYSKEMEIEFETFLDVV